MTVLSLRRAYRSVEYLSVFSVSKTFLLSFLIILIHFLCSCGDISVTRVSLPPLSLNSVTRRPCLIQGAVSPPHEMGSQIGVLLLFTRQCMALDTFRLGTKLFCSDLNSNVYLQNFLLE